MTTYKPLLAGQQSEDSACQYLQSRGMVLIKKNYRCYHGEIDLIMRDRDDIVFVEVRSRGRADYGNALESVTPAKIRKLIRTASHFLQMQQWLNKVNSRFDIIAIHPVAGSQQLDWIKNAFTVDR